MRQMAQIFGQMVSNSNPNLSSAVAKRNERPKRRLKLSEGPQGKPQKEHYPQVIEVDTMIEQEDEDRAEVLAK